MTSSRIVRGTKARVFLYVCVVLVVVGVIACYNSTLSQLDNIKKANDVCHKQEEHLTTQLQVITDYKQRLEKSLKSEQAEHLQAKNDFENKLNEEKARNEKILKERDLHISSLKQQYNLLQTQYEDFQEECSKTKKQQLEEVNDIQAKLKEIQEELKKERSAKDNLKSEYLQVRSELDNLQNQMRGNSDTKAADESRIHHLEKVNYELKRDLGALKEKCPADVVQQILEPIVSPSSEDPNKNAQVSSSSVKNQKLLEENVAQEPPAQEKQEKRVLGIPNSSKLGSSSTTSSNMKYSKASLDGARPLRLPTLTPSTSKRPPLVENMQNHVLLPPHNNRKLPQGVVPMPVGHVDEGNDLPNDVMDNRYMNQISNNAIKESKPKLEEVEKENGANEEFDAGLDGDMMEAVGFGDERNDAVKNAERQNFRKEHIDQLAMVDHKEKNDVPVEKQEYKEAANEENEPEEDDDADDYGDHQKEPAVRN